MSHGRHSSASSSGRALAPLAVLSATFFFSTGGTGRALLNFVGTSTEVAAWRVFVGGTVLVLVVASRGGLAAMRQIVRMPVAWLMGASVLAYQLTFFRGAQVVGIGVGTLVAQAAAPLTAGLLGWALTRLRPTALWVVCTGIALGGLIMITGRPGELDSASLALCASSGILYAGNVVLGSKLVRELGVSGAHVMGATFGLGAVMSAPFVARSGSWITTREGVALIAWNGLMATAVAYLLFGFGITHLAAPIVSTLAVAEPVMATMQGVWLLGEPMTRLGAAGCVVIVLALAGLSLGQRRNA